MMLRRVDLPAPLEPITVTNSPGARCRDTSFSATRAFTVPGANVLLMFSSFSTSLLLVDRGGLGDGGEAVPHGAAQPREALPLRQHEREHHEDRRDQLHVVRVEAGHEGQLDDHAIPVSYTHLTLPTNREV